MLHVDMLTFAGLQYESYLLVQCHPQQLLGMCFSWTLDDYVWLVALKLIFLQDAFAL